MLRTLFVSSLLYAQASAEWYNGYTLGYYDVPVQVLECTTTAANAPGQVWSLSAINSTTFEIQFAAPVGSTCVDVPAVWIPGVNATIVADVCSSTSPSEYFAWSGNTIVALITGQCLTLAMDNNANGTQVLISNCTGAPSQQWRYDNTTGQLIAGLVSPTGASLCLDASTVWRQCSIYPFNTYPYCNSSLTIDERVADIIARATPTEKYGQLLNNGVGMPSLGIPPFDTTDFTHSVSGLPMISWG